MRKQMKIAAVVSAAALLALGASITSFAASKGTWKYDDGEWYCYDKNGDVYTNTFCLSNGKEFYVGDSGEMVTSSWVDYEGELYFVNSSGQKVVNDWRLATPYEDDSADEEWYFFQSTGKMAKTKKLTIKGKTYFFNGDGQMLTGWVTADGVNTVDEAGSYEKDHTYYCDETGARIEKGWVYAIEPGVDEEDTDADEHYYYLKSNGKIATGKQANIKGQTYFFTEEGKMLTGWVATTDGDAYESIQGDDDNEDYYKALSSVSADGGKAYYCNEEDGHMRKNKWIKVWKPKHAYDEDEDNAKKWFWLEKDGKVYIPSGADATAVKYKLEDGKLLINSDETSYSEKVSDATVSVAKKKVNSKDYFFNTEGEMVNSFIYVTTQGSGLKEGMYYFGGSDDGAMKTGALSIKDNNDDTYKFYFETKGDKGLGVIGNKSGKLYYMGQLVTSDDYRYEIAKLDNHYFIINKNGAIQHSKTEYKEDGDVLVDARGTKNEGTGKYENAPEFIKTGAYKDGLTSTEYDKVDASGTNMINVEAEYLEWED